jgi:TfoX/Sxy family transcriptional regulator of competence genes
MSQHAGMSQDRYDALITALLTETGVTFGPPGSGFGATALKVHNKIFAMLVEDRLVVKLPRQRVDRIVDAGNGQRFDPGTGRIMKEWVALEPSSTEDWLSLAREARTFVASQQSRTSHRNHA